MKTWLQDLGLEKTSLLLSPNKYHETGGWGDGAGMGG